MRVAAIALISLLVGLLAGFGLTTAEFAGVEELFASGDYRPATAKETIEVVVEPAQAVVLGGKDYDFGTLRRNERGEHVFKIRNDGDDLLRIELRSRSCGRCIATRFEAEDVTSDNTIEIPVEYYTGKPEENFHEHIELITNDPNQKVMRLSITGKVTERIRMSAQQVRFETVAASDGASQLLRVFGYHSDRLEVLSHEFTDPATADHFELVVTPLDVTELEMDPLPRAACEVRVEMKPGMPIGPITQSIMLEVQADDISRLNLPVVGTVRSDISVIGPKGFYHTKNLLDLGRIKRDEGTKRTLQIRVRGSSRDDVELRVDSTEPAEALRATIGERVVAGEAYMYPLEVVVPPGTPLVNRLGGGQGDLAKITIATTHEDSRQLLILVRFIVE